MYAYLAITEHPFVLLAQSVWCRTIILRVLRADSRHTKRLVIRLEITFTATFESIDVVVSYTY